MTDNTTANSAVFMLTKGSKWKIRIDTDLFSNG